MSGVSILCTDHAGFVNEVQTVTDDASNRSIILTIDYFHFHYSITIDYNRLIVAALTAAAKLEIVSK